MSPSTMKAPDSGLVPLRHGRTARRSGDLPVDLNEKHDDDHRRQILTRTDKGTRRRRA
jgi:hypothetical protein